MLGQHCIGMFSRHVWNNISLDNYLCNVCPECTNSFSQEKNQYNVVCMCQHCTRKLHVQCWPISHGQQPTLCKGINSIILAHSWQKTFLSKITQTMLCLPSWENIAYNYARVFFLIKLQASGLQLYLKRDSGTGVFLQILWNFLEPYFYRTPPDNCFCIGQLYTQCCPNMYETTLHKKITCTILALSTHQWFQRKITFTIFF